MRKKVFCKMVSKWIAGHANDPEFIADPLRIGEPEIDEDLGLVCYAEDSVNVYALTDDGTGKIRLDYIGTK